MRILVLNCGSSTLKLHLYDVESGELGWETAPAATGLVQRIGRGAHVRFESPSGVAESDEDIHDHAAASLRALDWLGENGLGDVSAVAHRVVHGGSVFSEPALLDDDAIEEIDRLTELAPLHNGPALQAIRAVRSRLGSDVPMVASFDTAFHSRMPERASLYALPLDLQERHGIRRYGFHGLAHRYMMERYAFLTGRSVESLRVITLQLGAGCSAAAVRDGVSVDTTMGFTPLEGLMMATRSGDVDPSLPAFIAEREGTDVDEAVRIFNEESGLKGVSGRSGDMRELMEAEAGGDGRAALAVEMFCYRIAKAVGSYLAALEGADAVLFGGGIGENSPAVRDRVCGRLAWAGLKLDSSANEAAVGNEARISALDSIIDVWAVTVNEALMIGRDTIERLRAV